MPGYHIGIDLGTSKVTAFQQGKGIVYTQANAICYETRTGAVAAVGTKAMEMAQRTPAAFHVERPMADGVISDFTVMRHIFTDLIEKVCARQIFRPNLIITAPSGITLLQKRTIMDVAVACGAGKVSLIDNAIASALGSGIPIDKPHGVLMLDNGAGTADIAVITMGTVAFTTACRIGGMLADEMLTRFFIKERSLELGISTIQRIKHVIGCAFPREEELELSVGGKDHVTQLPVTASVTSSEVCAALQPWTQQLCDAVHSVLEQTPAELYRDICEEGILLTGGMAQLYGLDRAIEEQLHLEVHVCADGANAAAKGAGLSLRHLKTLEDHGYLFRAKERRD